MVAGTARVPGRAARRVDNVEQSASPPLTANLAEWRSTGLTILARSAGAVRSGRRPMPCTPASNAYPSRSKRRMQSLALPTGVWRCAVTL